MQLKLDKKQPKIGRMQPVENIKFITERRRNIMKLSDNLRIIRKENNLSQEQLAEKLGVSRQAVSKWESGQSYPEMDKVLLICKIFNYNIDELMNENVKEVNDNKQSKINLNKYIEDFFEFITKTVDMLSIMTFKQIIKCIFEQILIGIFFVCIFAIIGSIGQIVVTGIIGGLSYNVSHILFNICESIYIILCLIIGITIMLHIFKIRYLDYYEIVKNDEEKRDSKDEESSKDLSSDTNNCNKTFIEKKKERIIIRDPNHSESKFLNGIIKVVVLFIKVMVALYSCVFIFSFVSLVILLVLSFLFIKTGAVFVGGFLSLLAGIIINFIILEILYNFIVNKKCKKTRMAIMFMTSLVVAGIGIGTMCIGFTQFEFISDIEKNQKEEVYETVMTDNLSLHYVCNNIEYIETNSNKVKIIVKYSDYIDVKIDNTDDTIDIYFQTNNKKMSENIKEIIKDINDKKIKNYGKFEVYVYASKDNIKAMKQNRKRKYKEQEIESRNNTIEILERKIEDLESEAYKKDEEINNLQEELIDIKEKY